MKELLFHSLEQAGVSAYGVERIRIAAAQMVEDNITPAQVIVAARKGTLLVHQANGKFGPEPGAAELTVDAIYPLCSITKLFTATAIMMLMEQGKIGLNRPVSDYIPEFTGEGKTKVCVHHLLTHTSGLEGEVIWQNGQLKKEQGEYLHTNLIKIQISISTYMAVMMHRLVTNLVRSCLIAGMAMSCWVKSSGALADRLMMYS